MGNVVSRYIGCTDIEIIEYSRRDESGSDDHVRLVECVEFVELAFDNNVDSA